jgi:hypothetical protein
MPTPRTTDATRPHAPPARGFVVLVVLVVLAILSAVVVSQFAVATSNAAVAGRNADDARARALAESCLTMMQGYVDRFLGSPVPDGRDFDALLDDDNTPATISGREFLPPANTGETTVLMPKGLTGDADLLQRHRWLLIPRDVGSERGACLVRFDDNSDDTLPLAALPAGNDDDLGEGANRAATDTSENPYKDRDRAIFLTAVGLFPYLTTTDAEDAFDAAHARVTLRRLSSTSTSGVPTIHAGGTIDGIKGSLCSASVGTISRVTGSGKVFFPKGGCGCGQMIADTAPVVSAACTSSLPLPPDCACAAVTARAAPFDAAALTARLNAQRPPSTSAAGDWLAAAQPAFLMRNQNFGPAPRPGSAPSLVNISADDLGADMRSCKLLFTNVGEVFVWDVTEPGCSKVDDRTDSPVPRPCTTWNPTGPDLATCSDGPVPGTKGPTTRCWRRIHSGGGAWQPNSGADIANVGNGVARRWGAAVGATTAPAYLCGDPTPPLSSCATCNGAGSPATFASGTWTLNNLDDADLPVPSYLFVENTAASAQTTVTFKSSNSMPHVTLVGNAGFTFSEPPKICGVGCDCSAVTSSFGSGSDDCEMSDPIVRTLAPEQCAAVTAFGDCKVTSGTGGSSFFVGDVRCGIIDDDARDLCYIGDVAAMSADPARECTGDVRECDTGSGFCQSDDMGVVGNVYAAMSINIVGESTFRGVIASEQSFCSDGDIRLDGAIVVGRNTGFKGEPVLAGVGSTSLRAMIETAW